MFSDRHLIGCLPAAVLVFQFLQQLFQPSQGGGQLGLCLPHQFLRLGQLAAVDAAFVFQPADVERIAFLFGHPLAAEAAPTAVFQAFAVAAVAPFAFAAGGQYGGQILAAEGFAAFGVEHLLKGGQMGFGKRGAFAAQKWADIPNAVLQQLGSSLNNWTLLPSGSDGHKKAEATRGGVNVKEIDPKTMQSKLQPGLYFIGEVMDITGWLGGYNFQWAWASAVCAAEAVG